MHNASYLNNLSLPDLILTALTLWVLVIIGMVVASMLRSSHAQKSSASPAAVRNAVNKLNARVFLVRPCAGTEGHLLENLVSADIMGGAHLAGVWHLVAESDPAQRIVEQATALLRERGVNAECILTHPTGANHKASQMAEAMSRSQSGDIWFCVDSDVDMSTFDASPLLHALENADATWAPWCEGGFRPCSVGDRLSEAVSNGSFHAFPLLWGVAPWSMVGKVMAVRFNALKNIGGWNHLVNYLGEDFELGAQLRAHGHRIVPAPVIPYAHVTGRSVSRIVQRHIRWILVVRGQRPSILINYPLFFFYAAPIAAACAAIAWRAPTLAPMAALVAATAAICRVVTAYIARKRCGNPVTVGRILCDVVMSDALLTFAWTRAVVNARVAWRGRRLIVGRNGVLRAES